MAVFSMTPLISADTGDGAAGCASGNQTCSGRIPALAPNPNSASRNAAVAQWARQRARAHRVEREQPGAALQDAEAQQDRDRADVRHQQVQEAGAADLRNAVLGGHQEVRRQGHGLPRDHERVGVVGQQDEPHAGKEEVVLQPEQPRCGALALAEVTGSEQRHADGGAAEQHQEDPREIVQPDVHRQVRQSDRQRGSFDRGAETQEGHDCEAESDARAERKQHPADEGDAGGSQQSGDRRACPAREQCEASGKG